MAAWREDIDALEFRPAGHQGLCLVHRLTLRTVIGRLAAPEECLAYFAAHRERFEAAARDKIARAALPAGANFHLTSRDIAGQSGAISG
ncbi:MAG TPA: DUF1488 family protein [Magnetospirillaceae bacterium]|nr:DUF1488 family protein [Magnetospirillaceae bacterium]